MKANSSTDEASLNPLQMLIRSFSSKTFCWVAPMVISVAVFMGLLCLFCAWQMFMVDAIANKIHWAVGTLASLMVTLVIRIWLFLEMHRLSLIREIQQLKSRLPEPPVS